ncbi:MAG: hypothetical protein F6K47_23225 [Symploca sp. SIO2E6]|nr:hypothetical protein [Symploca sp. SIO2E6]
MILEQQEEKTIEILGKFVLELKKREKASTPQLVVEQVLYWTDCHPALVSKICQLILQSESTIHTNKEKEYVEQLVQQDLIKSWHTQTETEPIPKIHAQLINNQNCDPFWLLLSYKQILQADSLASNGSTEQQELLRLGLVIKRQERLRVYNRIYQEVFNSTWLNRTLEILRPYAREISTWLASDGQDASQLLQGEALAEALNWTKGKGKLNPQEDKFLIASQVFNLRGT